ncbi:C-type lectin domain family 2 member A-like isoform X1 [Pelodiscus sinensis]|uniref:C-type lectin domain family 2 member A-like isoform X1 n=1 Tax=Pelodiscus sinensis TaxID=13735 RepID=UPI003F6C5348
MLPGQAAADERSDADFSLKCLKEKRIPILVIVIITALIITIIALAAKKTPPCPSCSLHVTAACPDGWVGFQGKCSYFSEMERNWTTSRNHCASLNASLATVDSLAELAFMLRYRGLPFHWIGLQREQDQGQPWKWTNGTIFNNLRKHFHLRMEPLQHIMGTVFAGPFGSIGPWSLTNNISHDALQWLAYQCSYVLLQQ